MGGPPASPPGPGGGAKHCCLSEIPRPALADRPDEAALLARLWGEMAHPDDVVERLALGRRFVAVAAGGRVGLASTLGAEPRPGDQAALAALTGRPLAEAARLLEGDSPLMASVGLAALNAALDPPIDGLRAGAEEILLTRAKGRRVVVMGDFPFIPRLSLEAAQLTVLELKPGADTPPPHEWRDALASCQVAALTSTALLTRSMAWALAAARDAFTVLIGPSTPWARCLMDLGADVLAGAVVEQEAPVLAAVEEGLPFKIIKQRGVRSMCLSRVPRPSASAPIAGREGGSSR